MITITRFVIYARDAVNYSSQVLSSLEGFFLPKTSSAVVTTSSSSSTKLSSAVIVSLKNYLLKIGLTKAVIIIILCCI